ncbi:hypothetical protein ABBQ32_003797 [Trebouxia sp. C0010 RCD-2024]
MRADDSDVEVGEEDGHELGGQFPADDAVAVEFGWEDKRPLTGRRLKAAKDKQKKAKSGSFETLGLSPEVLRGIKRKGYRLPTPIQRKTLPLILQRQDVVGMARTGSGKTAAFVIPLLERLKGHSLRGGARAVLLAPTRELALQTHKVVKELSRYTNLRTAVLVGGDSMEAQFAELAANPDIIVATPGRLMHHLKEVEGMSLRTVEYCVFDEADRLFEMGFAAQLQEILNKMNESRQTLLFSATMPSALHEFAKAGLKDPEMVRLDTDARISADLSTAFFTVRAEDKIAALLWLVREAIGEGAPTLVFASTRHHVEFLHTLMTKEGIDAACVYGAMDQAARKIHTGRFRAGKVHLMIVTDVAARGIDIPLLDNVINFDFPAKPKLFVHRVGRAARAGRLGTAYSLLTREELPYLIDLHLFLSRPLVPAPVRSLQQAAAAAPDLDPSTSVYGTFPQAALDDSIEHAREALTSSHDLIGMQKSCNNAFSLYKRTRPPAAPESVARAKALPKEGVHPLLAAKVPVTSGTGLEAQAGLADITQSLKNYRPSVTVLEAQMAPSRRGEGAGGTGAPGLTAANSPDGGLVAVMEQKRNAHDQAIKANKRQKLMRSQTNTLTEDFDDELGDGHHDTTDEAVSDDSGEEEEKGHQQAAAGFTLDLGAAPGGDTKFRDDNFYLGYDRGDNRYAEEGFAVGGRGEDMVLDLAGDENDTMASLQKRHHWDKRKRRYIQLQPKEEVKAGKRVKTESGATATGPDAPSGLYQKWVKTNKRRVSHAGEEENGAAAAYSKNLANRFKKGGRGWVNPAKAPAGPAHGKGPKPELRTMDQVRKSRKDAERKKSRMSGEHKRGGAADAAGSSRATGSGGNRFSKSTHGPPASARGVQAGGRGRGGGAMRGSKAGSSRGGMGRGGNSRGSSRGGVSQGGGRGGSRGGSRGGRGGGPARGQSRGGRGRR